MCELVQTFEADLWAIEQDETLRHEANFAERIHALDVLGRDLLDRIEDTLYVHGYREDLASLYRRATVLSKQLDAVNANLFQRLQAQLAADADHPTTLHQLCEVYVKRSSSVPPRADTDEDYLDLFVNGLLGIDHVPEETIYPKPEMIGYVPTPARAIFTLLAHANLHEHDVFYDLGAGLGRVSLLVGLLTPARAKGIEIEPAYCRFARQRAQRLNLSQVSFINQDAGEADYTDGTLFFMYTPFTGRLLQQVLDKLGNEARTRRISLAAYGPCTLHVERQSWLQPTFRQTFHPDPLVLYTSR
ncbi:MAG: class I SAM-dependent methyltransferase [Candidatus Tectomicrobia bacterium]|nr:class I SAM-dependent methyltransferase [Candidatus Tectomicrobia bacterium]